MHRDKLFYLKLCKKDRIERFHRLCSAQLSECSQQDVSLANLCHEHHIASAAAQQSLISIPVSNLFFWNLNKMYSLLVKLVNRIKSLWPAELSSEALMRSNLYSTLNARMTLQCKQWGSCNLRRRFILLATALGCKWLICGSENRMCDCSKGNSAPEAFFSLRQNVQDTLTLKQRLGLGISKLIIGCFGVKSVEWCIFLITLEISNSSEPWHLSLVPQPQTLLSNFCSRKRCSPKMKSRQAHQTQYEVKWITNFCFITTHNLKRL